MKNIFKKIVIKILTWEAKMVLLRYKPKIIAVTGSVGKTSTKDAIFTVLSRFKTVRKSDKSYNSEIGIPLTILGIPNGWNSIVVWIENILHGALLILWKRQYPEWLVLEVGAGKPNDIKDITSWLKPDIAVITRFPDKPVHVEFFGSVEKIIKEKSYLAFALKKDGILVLNHDDEKVYALHEKADKKTISYGENENATYTITYPTYIFKTQNDITIPSGINFKLGHDGNNFPVILPNVIGLHYIGGAMAALAVANEIGCDLLLSIDAISEYIAPPGRLSLIEGINDSIIIDDTYNSSPVAMSAALEVLSQVKAKDKIAVLGDMLELGKFTDDAHYEIGEQVAKIADILITVGLRSKFIAKGAEENGLKENKIHSFETVKEATKFLKNIISRGDVILLKGSQGIRLEKTVEAIMAHPELASKLLGRQDKEWKKR